MGKLSSAQGDKFQQPSYFKDVATVYEYRKSNWDGTHSSTIYLYIKDSMRLESFKWFKGDKEATLVTADMDWKTFSVRKFENHKLRSEQNPEHIASLITNDKNQVSLELKNVKDSMLLDALPWHSYDFDFAGLSFSWRALKKKDGPFYFHIADVATINGQPKFVNKGTVEVNYIGKEMLDNVQCLKYSIDGAGLENKGGLIWIDPETSMIRQYKILLPDEPGFTNGMIKLIKTHRMNVDQWKKFMQDRLAE